MNRERLLENKKIWYSRIFVLMEVVKNLKERELCFIAKKDEAGLKHIRYLIAHNIDYLKKHFDRVHFDTALLNMYQSVSMLKEIPVFSYNLMQRTKEEKYKTFNKEYKNYVIGYDLFLDFDGKENFKRCHAEAQEMKRIFDNWKIPYWVMNSSSNGFHFHIPAEYMPKKDIEQTLVDLNNALYNLKGIYDFECLDETVIDMKRVCKVPYSFVNDGTICLPLTDAQLKSFDRKYVEPLFILRSMKLKNRGLLLRKHNLTDEQLKTNVETFLEEFK